MNPPHRAIALAAAIAVTGALTAAASSFAQGMDDRAVATAILLKLQQNAQDGRLVAAPLARAKDALDRAARLRGAGDEAHARAAAGLAREWAETARDLARAADAEQTGAELRRKAVDAQARVERSSALVEEAIARAGRLRAELEVSGRPASREKP